jgi:hypothetical protein
MHGKVLSSAGLTLALALSALSSGCSSVSSCSRPEENVTVEFSPSMLTNGVFFSAPFGGPYQFFPGGRTLHFKHGLGAVPLPPTFWVAFAEEGKGGDNPLAVAAGNMGELLTLDAEEIAVKNDTCTELYIWFYAEAQPPIAKP